MKKKLNKREQDIVLKYRLQGHNKNNQINRNINENV